MANSTEERINSVKITDTKGTIGPAGEVYELDFCRESVSFAESRGFKPENVADFPVNGVSDLFFYSFRMHNRGISREKVDRLRDARGGVPEKVLQRLLELYQQAMTHNMIQLDEDAEKNGAVTVEL